VGLGGAAGPRETIRGIIIHNSNNKTVSAKAKDHAKNPARKDLEGFAQKFRIKGKTLRKVILALESCKEGKNPKNDRHQRSSEP
jgi:hypothetical protein